MRSTPVSPQASHSAVLHSDLVNFAGVAPIILRMAETGEVKTIDGLGTWPHALRPPRSSKQTFGGEIPEGILRTVVPAAPAAWLTVLGDFGTMTFGEVAAAGHPLCARRVSGFPCTCGLHRQQRGGLPPLRRERPHLPARAGSRPRSATLLVQSDLAATIQYMVDEEKSSRGGRKRGLAAALQSLLPGRYCAEDLRISRVQSRPSWTLEDMAKYRVRYEEPVRA